MRFLNYFVTLWNLVRYSRATQHGPCMALEGARHDVGKHHYLQRSQLWCLRLLRGRGSFRIQPSLVPYGFTGS